MAVREPKRKIVNRPPIEAKTFNQICQLPRDNDGTGNFWWIIDESTISIHEQKPGESSVQAITLPRKVFEQAARWYLTGSKQRPESRKRADAAKK